MVKEQLGDLLIKQQQGTKEIQKHIAVFIKKEDIEHIVVEAESLNSDYHHFRCSFLCALFFKTMKLF